MTSRGPSLHDFCRSMPKVELHAHLNGSISPSTIQKLLLRHGGSGGLQNDATAVPEVWKSTIAKGEKRTLEDCFAMFKMIHTLVNDEEAVETVAHDVVTEFAEDGVVYLELRSTPRANPATNMTKKSYVEAVLRGIHKALSELTTTAIYVALLLSIDRRHSVSEAQETVELASQYTSPVWPESTVRVVGIDLSGDPTAGDVESLLPVLKSAKERGLKLSLHIAEVPDKNVEIEQLLKLRPDRLGHGTFIHPCVGGTEEAVKMVIDHRIPIEVCLTSNVKSQTALNYDSHHFAFWWERDHPVVICTDDKGVFSTKLSEEYAIAGSTFSLSQQDLWSLAASAVDFTFESQDFKKDLKRMWASVH